MKQAIELSVFFPAYNEEKNIKDTVLNAVNVLKNIAATWEVLVVNDGSTDKTAKIVAELMKKNKNIRIVNHSENRGYGAAIKTGFNSCKYKLIAQVDSDGQFTFSEINNFLAKIDKADLVIGYRKKRIDSLYRRLLQRILWLADWFLFGLNIRDVDCGFKLIRKKVVETIGELKTESAITVTELMVRATRANFRIVEVGVEHHPRFDGEQTGGKLKVVFKAAREGLWLWWILLTEKNNFLTAKR